MLNICFYILLKDIKADVFYIRYALLYSKKQQRKAYKKNKLQVAKPLATFLFFVVFNHSRQGPLLDNQ